MNTNEGLKGIKTDQPSISFFNSEKFWIVLLLGFLSIIYLGQSYNPEVFIMLISGTAVFMLSYFLHEWGHYLIHFVLKHNPKVEWKWFIPIKVIATSDKPFGYDELALASFAGVVFGTEPFLTYYRLFYQSPNILYFVLPIFLIYLYCCKSDFKDMRNYYIQWKLIKGKTKDE